MFVVLVRYIRQAMLLPWKDKDVPAVYRGYDIAQEVKDHDKDGGDGFFDRFSDMWKGSYLVDVKDWGTTDEWKSRLLCMTYDFVPFYVTMLIVGFTLGLVAICSFCWLGCCCRTYAMGGVSDSMFPLVCLLAR